MSRCSGASGGYDSKEADKLNVHTGAERELTDTAPEKVQADCM